MAGKKIITVFGATGAQGGGVVDTFLNDPKLKEEWTVRGVTRDVTKDSSKKLAERGVEVVAADMSDKASLTKAMTGAYAVFVVTNYWEKADINHEVEQGKRAADAAKEAGVQLYVWSSLYNITKISNGALSRVYHFDSKAMVEDYIRELGIPATFFMPGFYMSNFTGMGMLRQMPDNSWAIALPISSKAVFPLFDTADGGKFVKAAVLNRDKVLGKRMLACSAYMTGDEMVETFKKVFPEAGKTAKFFTMPEDMYRGALKGTGMPDHGIDELYENMLLLDGVGYYGGESLDWTHDLLQDKLTTWEGFLRKTPKFAELK